MPIHYTWYLVSIGWTSQCFQIGNHYHHYHCAATGSWISYRFSKAACKGSRPISGSRRVSASFCGAPHVGFYWAHVSISLPDSTMICVYFIYPCFSLSFWMTKIDCWFLLIQTVNSSQAGTEHTWSEVGLVCPGLNATLWGSSKVLHNVLCCVWTCVNWEYLL